MSSLSFDFRMTKAFPATAIVLFAVSALADVNIPREVFDANASGNHKKEVTLLIPYATSGNSWAQLTLGRRYEDGLGVVQDYATASKWYRLAAIQGNRDAQFRLALIYNLGQGVVQDYAESAKWYRRAAAQGDAGAQYNLGEMYADGRGVEKNYVRAHMWFNLSAASNEVKIASRGRDIVAERMTASQIAEAQKLARECQARDFREC